jgi:hypothetical protein
MPAVELDYSQDIVGSMRFAFWYYVTEEFCHRRIATDTGWGELESHIRSLLYIRGK